jgi:hypothetical protein
VCADGGGWDVKAAVFMKELCDGEFADVCFNGVADA